MRPYRSGLPRALARPATVLAALAVTTSALVSVSAPASAVPSTSLALSPYRQTQRVGQIASYTATLVSGSTRLSGKTVEFWVRPQGNPTWTKWSTTTTDMNGHALTRFAVRYSTFVQAKFPATSAYAGSVSPIAGVVASQSLGEKAVAEAARHYGKPYQWGAVGPSRFDCSGFTLYVWSRLGRSLPHNAAQQYNTVRRIAPGSKQVGDLIFIPSNGRIGHVSIYAGNGYIWHSPHSGSYVKKVRIYSSTYYVGRVA